MARLWSSGFELNSTTANVELTTINGSATFSTTTVRSGTYALRISSLSSGVSQGVSFTFASADGNGPFFYRFYFRYATLPSADNTIFRAGSSGPSEFGRMKLASDGSLKLFAGSTQIGSASSALTANTWYRVEVEFNHTGGAGAGVLKAQVDGSEFAASTTATLGTVSKVVVGGNFGVSAEAQTTGDWFFDDLAINDNTGSFQTTYPGSGKIIHLKPNASGDNSAWTGSNTDIDEVTPNDATDTINTTIAGNTSDFNIEDTPAGLGSNDVINVVQLGHRSIGTGVTKTTYVLRIKASSAGTTEESSTYTPAGSYTTNQNATPFTYPLTLYDLPGASTTAWTKSDLDTAQVGVRSVISVGGQTSVTTMWLLVDYTPDAGGGGGGTPSDNSMMMRGMGT